MRNNNKKIILGFVGELAGGKGTSCDYLIKKYGAGYHRFSTILRDVLKRLYIETSRENMQKISTVLRKNFSEDILARVIADDVKNDPHQVVAVDGVRREADIKYLREIEGFHLVYITADIEKRFERIKKRDENPDDAGKTFEQFKLDHLGEADLEIPLVGAKANFKIDNNGTIEKLYAQIEKILGKISNASS
ncbi:MAG: AAA family ATPase [bacterium]